MQNFTNRQKNIICAVVSAPLVLLLMVAGVCKAYDMIMYSMMESSLTNAVHASEAVHRAVIEVDKTCEAQYQLMVQFKNNNKIALSSSTSPCPLN